MGEEGEAPRSQRKGVRFHNTAPACIQGALDSCASGEGEGTLGKEGVTQGWWWAKA